MDMHSANSGKTSFPMPGLVTGSLTAGAVSAFLAAVGDVALILSVEGTILDTAVSNGELASHGFGDWVGRAWIDTIASDSQAKVPEMLRDALSPGSGKALRWRQVNHPTPGGDIPVSYMVLALDGDHLIAIGRDLRGAAAMQQRLLQAQQAIERDYIRLRQSETRYRTLFDMVSEPVLIVDADDRRIREANPAAHRLLDASLGDLATRAITEIVATEHRDDLIAHLGAAETADDCAPIALRLANRRGTARVSARLFRQAGKPLFIVRVETAPENTAEVSAVPQFDGLLRDVLERMPDSFVLVDSELNVLTANAAFLELTEVASIDRVVGAKLGNWLGRPGIDLDLIVAQLREHGSVRNLATILRGAAGAKEEIEISAVVAPMGESECYGFTIRDVGRRERSVLVNPGDVPRSVGQLTGLVGRMSLKDIVRESTDLIERLCIEAALVYTSDNRASAAEILGVSRQSLYSKLHRHGLGNLVSAEI
jgi:transcriptional regulator PpsR